MHKERRNVRGISNMHLPEMELIETRLIYSELEENILFGLEKGS